MLFGIDLHPMAVRRTGRCAFHSLWRWREEIVTSVSIRGLQKQSNEGSQSQMSIQMIETSYSTHEFIQQNNTNADFPALIILPSICNVSATATKLIAPPIWRLHNAEATFHPSSPKLLRGINANAPIVPIIVDNAPTKKAISNDPVSLITLCKSESNRNNGTGQRR